MTRLGFVKEGPFVILSGAKDLVVRPQILRFAQDDVLRRSPLSVGESIGRLRKCVAVLAAENWGV